MVLQDVPAPRLGAGPSRRIGRSAIQVVERIVHLPSVPVPVPVKANSTPVNWPETLATLAAQLDSGRIYDRDLVALSTALDVVLAAFERHAGVRRRR